MTPTDPDRGAHHYSDAEMHNEDVAHEHSDINIRTVLAFGGGPGGRRRRPRALMSGSCSACSRRRPRRDDPQLSPLALPAGQQPPGAAVC